ncbi:reverse [Lasius niger]|uniref:Reverse n=1 Tax=Lasius niger TaxID=67767 RepID=A0A0J7KS51_LASNI|nr:reverse [Lasius niger]
MWQARWTSSNKGRTTFVFFDEVRNRLDARFLQIDHWVTRALTGHENFRARLASLGLVVDGAACICGGQNDTVQHFLLECPLFDAQRVALREIVPDGGSDIQWPAYREYCPNPWYVVIQRWAIHWIESESGGRSGDCLYTKRSLIEPGEEGQSFYFGGGFVEPDPGFNRESGQVAKMA